MAKWYAVTEGGDTSDAWTLSNDPNKPGWQTDSGFSGYGLSKERAAWIALVLNTYTDNDEEVPD